MWFVGSLHARCWVVYRIAAALGRARRCLRRVALFCVEIGENGGGLTGVGILLPEGSDVDVVAVY